MSLTEMVRNALDNSKFACGIFVDFQKAFDTVDHNLLLEKLEHYGVRGLANNWFKSYLSNRQQYVSVNGFHSNTLPMKYGVPQGSVLGPLLFLIYINDLHNAIRHSVVHHFADDTNLLYVSENLKTIQNRINQDLKSLCTWLRANKISLNASKTELIIFRDPRKKMKMDLKIKIQAEFKALDTRKATRHMNIPTKQLKEVMDIVDKPLQAIWNDQILKELKFPDKLKLADITPLHKKLETVLKENYRPVSVLAVVSKVFERIMDKQTDAYMGKYLSKFICGYRKRHGPEHALLYMIERWKKSLDNKGYAGGVLMDLSKAFDTINHKLLLAKLHAYGFDVSALEIIYDYLSNRFQRTKINSSFSSWSLMLSGMPQGSVNGPKWFNYYINDMFFLFVYTSVCNMADDTTPFACDSSLDTLIKKLEKM